MSKTVEEIGAEAHRNQLLLQPRPAIQAHQRLQQPGSEWWFSRAETISTGRARANARALTTGMR